MPTKRSEFVQTIRAQFLGQRMRKLRDDRGLTLKYVAGYLGVEFSTLARYERAECQAPGLVESWLAGFQGCGDRLGHRV
jgi:hypothetical protein